MANATVRVQFGDPDGTTTGHLSAEIDARTDGLNGGKTAFTPGETVYLLVYASANVTVTVVKMLVTGLVMALLAGAFLKLKLFGGGQ